MTKLIVEINGADETGKTTQSSLLGIDDTFVIVPPRHLFSDKWGKPDSKGREIGKREWWFASDNTEEFLDVMITALAKRAEYVAALPDDNIALLDRGDKMVLAALTASVRIKEVLDAPAARRRVAEKAALLELPAAQGRVWRVFLEVPGSIADKVSSTLKRSGIGDNDDFNPTYRNYQTFLQEELKFMQENAGFDQAIVTRGSALEVQDEIRGSLSTKFNGVSASLGQHIRGILFLLGAEQDTAEIVRHLRDVYGFETLCLPSQGALEAIGRASRVVGRAADEGKGKKGLFVIQGEKDDALLSVLGNMLGDKFAVSHMPSDRMETLSTVKMKFFK